jgi:tetratricopeptide (TPR) repeat protein
MQKFLNLAVLFFSLVSFAAPPSPSAAAKSAFDRAEKALEASKFDDAVAAYNEALKATPNYPAALNGLGSALFKQKKSAEAIASFKAATEVDPNFKLAWFNLGYSARKTSDFALAATAYEKYTALEANDADGFYGLAESYKALAQNEKAVAAYEKFLAKEKRPTEQKWIDKAKESIALLKTEAAPVALATPVAAPLPSPSPVAPAPAPAPAPEPAAALTTLAGRKLAEGDRAMQEKKYREASFAYQDAVNADANNVEALFKLGNSFAVLGYYSQAITSWQKVQQLATDAKVKQSAQDNITKAQQKLATTGGSPQEAGKPPGSGPVADTSRQQARQFYEAAVQYIGQRRYSEALSSLNECLKLEPALTVGYIARGSTLIGLRRFSEAALDYQYALKIDPSVSSPLYGLAEAYRGLNRVDDARGYYQRYVASTAPDARPELQTDARTKLTQLR